MEQNTNQNIDNPHQKQDENWVDKQFFNPAQEKQDEEQIADKQDAAAAKNLEEISSEITKEKQPEEKKENEEEEEKEGLVELDYKTYDVSTELLKTFITLI